MPSNVPEKTELPDNVIPIRPPVTIDSLLNDVMVQGELFAAELRVFLQKHCFAESYVDAVVPELLEAYMNNDLLPIWQGPPDVVDDADD